ncbi:S-adenosyl-L-methionine-dependent methyltransferase [Bombardia bombarda]|uniref:S-adenosyl-L-methionine-dependent methyltransferase n=1 Tax=Bombardia bombarda TaxID=252184 RepID=A0AA40CF78_9PEZI|nr:S-adenosyl-L-methionine-dependent methyltransferase [Bombardia bombarda]
MEDTTAALRAAEELVEALKKCKTPSPAEHLDLLARTNKVRMALEQPYDIITRQHGTILVAGAMYSLIGTGAIQKIPSEGSISASELAAAVNANISTITRLMRVAICNGIFEETAPDVYSHNSISQSYQLNALGGFFLICMDFNKAYLALPDYLKSHTPEDLFDDKKSPFAYAFGKEGSDYYEVLNEDIEKRNIWNGTMQAMEKNMPISGMFPFASLKEQVEREPERAFFVDVAGGRGQALLKLQEDIPGTFGGKLILQDLPIVIDSLKPEDVPNIETMKYDIFTPQPVKNAHVYFMRRLLHDFYNPVCVEILKSTVQSMGPDSRLIICDMLVPDKVEVNGPTELYWLDLNLMMISGKEKTLKEFHELLDAAGLELVKVWPSAIGATVQLETRLKRS